jgi:quinol monooxygenase YgiN
LLIRDYQSDSLIEEFVMTVMVTAEFKMKPEAAETVIQTMKEILPDTRAYDGCQEIKSYYEPDTHTLLLVEIWESSEHQQKYIGWRVETGLVDSVSEMLAAAPAFRTFEIRSDI